MSVTIKNEPTLVRPARSHWLNLETGPRRNAEPFSNEELYPILELDAPRLGVVRAQFSVTRYVASDATLGAVWTDWHVVLRDVHGIDPEHPDSVNQGPEVSYGPATGTAIREACEPIILAWLETAEYRAERRKAAAYAVRRELSEAPRSHNLTGARKTLELVRPHIGPMEHAHLAEALRLLEEASAYLDREPMAG